MKKSVLLLMKGAIAQVLFCSAIQSVHAQVSNPENWLDFVGSSANTSVIDTFRLQTFGKSAWDNWTFSLEDGASVVEDKTTMKLPIGSGATFQPFDTAAYRNVKIAVHAAGKYLNSGESLRFTVYREGQSTELTAHTVGEIDFLGYKLFTIHKSPCSLSISARPASGSSDGYYMTDSVFAYGSIPEYSLFSGSGDWNDTLRWTHLPPLRHRSALVNGDAVLTADASCNRIALHEGELQIAPGVRLSLNDLNLYGSDAALLSNGTLDLAGKMTVHKTFAETGKWYFISFPFDVYLSGIDSRFEQQDDTFSGAGNYFYLQTYNGYKRAADNQPSGNWEVVPVHTDPAVPLLEKNKGYLIALDASATDKTLLFSSRPGDLPADFAQTGRISVQLEADRTSENSENHGWYLCGNPFPAPLRLSQIETNASLDGNIYVYDGSGYQAYSIGSSYALPPFSAFFVKAFSGTEIRMSASDGSTKAVDVIPANAALATRSEPCIEEKSTHLLLSVADFRFSLCQKQLYLENVPSVGHIRLFDLTGQCIFQQAVTAGSQTVPLHGGSGLYILQISVAGTRQQYKVQLL